MDNSKFKDLVQRLSIFKNYSSLVVPVVIGVVAVLLFIPTQLMSSRFKKQIVNESISKGRSIKSLSHNPVAREQWREAEKYQYSHETDADQIALLARQSTQRELLSYKIFPESKDASELVFEQFGQQFRDSVEQLIARINGHDCPTEAELDRALNRTSSTTRPGWSGRQYSSRSQEYETTIIDEICREKAESASVYANPADLSGYEFWGKRESKSDKSKKFKYTGLEEAVKVCWYSQLAYWIIEDVIDTVGALNSGSNSVFTSRVKRILVVRFTTARSGWTPTSRGKETAVDEPHYVLSIEDALPESCTGRFCNEDIDVVHFNVVVVVSAKMVFPFMQELCSAREHKFGGFFGEAQEQVLKHNQITILESNITSINRDDESQSLYGSRGDAVESHSLYRYGKDAVVKLDLICEYIFNKDGYDKIKPESIKELLKKPEKPSGGSMGRQPGRSTGRATVKTAEKGTTEKQWPKSG